MIKKVVTLIVIVLAIVFFIINAIMNTSEIGNIREMKVVELSKTTTDVLKNKRFVLFMDNSGSMKGYMDFASTANPEEFKEAKRVAISTLSAILDNTQSTTGKEPVTICGRVQRDRKKFIADFQNSSLFRGSITELGEMMTKAADTANDSTIVGLFSDLVLSAGIEKVKKDIDYNRHHLDDLKATIHSAAKKIKNNGLDIAIVRYLSDFNGSYYCTYQEDKRKDLKDKCLKNRPYYIVLIGKSDVIQAMIENCFKLSLGENEVFSTVCQQQPRLSSQSFTITNNSTSAWIIGNPKSENTHDTSKTDKDVITLWTKSDLKHLKGTFDLTFNEIPMPYYASTEILPLISDGNKTIESVSEITRRSCKLTLLSYNKLPESGDVRFTLISKKNLWIDSNSSMDDDSKNSQKDMENKTWGLSAFTTGIMDAYGINESPLILAEFEIKILKK